MFRVAILGVVTLFLFVHLGDLGEFQQVDRRAVSVPRDVVLPVVAYQPDCPLKLTYIDIRAYVDGGIWPIVRLRNEGSKVIKAYKIALGSSAMISVASSSPDEWVDAGGELVLGDTSREHTVALTEEIRKGLDLRPPTRSVEVFMVVRLEFTDGSIYQDEKTFEALKAHLRM